MNQASPSAIHQLLDYWPVALTGLQVFVAWICWSLRQAARNEVAAVKSELGGKIEAHGARLQDTEARLDEVEDDIGQLPTKADIARLEGEVRGVSNQVTSANAGIQRIEGFFLAKGVERI